MIWVKPLSYNPRSDYSAFALWTGPYECYKWLVKQDFFSVKLEALDKNEVFSSWVRGIQFEGRLRLLRDAYMDPWLSDSILNAERTSDGMSLLRRVLGVTVRALSGGSAKDTYLALLLDVVEVLVRQGCRLDQTLAAILLPLPSDYSYPACDLRADQEREEPLIDLASFKRAAQASPMFAADQSETESLTAKKIIPALRHSHTRALKKLEFIHKWFQILSKAGINVQEYAQQMEAHGYKARTIYHDEAFSYDLHLYFWYEYGQTPEDVKISWIHHWRRSEDDLSMLGGWLDNERSYEPLPLLMKLCATYNLGLLFNESSKSSALSNLSQDLEVEDILVLYPEDLDGKKRADMLESIIQSK